MKILGSCCVGLAILSATVLVLAGKDTPPRAPEELPLAGFVKPSDRVGLIQNKEQPGLVLRALSKKDVEQIKQAIHGDFVELMDEKTFEEEKNKLISHQIDALPFDFFNHSFSVGDLNTMFTEGLRGIRVGTMVTVNPAYLVIRMDDEVTAPEILIPLAQIRRLEMGGTIFNMR